MILNGVSIYGVAPLAGAWIEIEALNNNTVVMTSPPSRGRGLK